MRFAHADFQARMMGSVRQRIETLNSQARPGQPDWRGFEWRWLQRLSASISGEVLAINASGFSAIAVSIDGRSLALGAKDGTVALVDARTGARLKSWVAHPSGSAHRRDGPQAAATGAGPPSPTGRSQPTHR
jgi:WD40 repeat protein